MAEDSEKRFHAIMDKLFHTPPKSKSISPPTSTTQAATANSTGIQLSRGQKRPSLETALSVVQSNSTREKSLQLQNSSSSSGTVQTSPCQPWDRGDLLKRLATFRSMTWFAKPQVVSAVNCARQGWVNVDMDIIACEACRARLLFSTPSSWTRDQVEKAASVFSLKLNSGHKLLCPWVDNACEETLAQFPPMSASVLVDNYKKRCSMLFHLSALPVISSSTVDSMRNPHLEHFLRVPLAVECGNEYANTPRTGSPSDESEAAVSSALYYQAQKLISLCGWEPHVLPYVVDCKDHSQSAKEANPSNLSNGISGGQNRGLSVYTLNTHGNGEAKSSYTASVGVESNPNSVVLDCQLCGASVGLWAFPTVPRPLEFLRLVGYSEVNGENDAGHHKDWASGIHAGNENGVESGDGTANAAITGPISSNERPVNLLLTIAGGPPPTKQNFRATICFPIIGQNLMAQFSSDIQRMDSSCVRSSPHGAKDQGMSLERVNVSEQGISEASKSDATEHQLENSDTVVEGSVGNGELTENAETIFTAHSARGDCCRSPVKESFSKTQDGHVTLENDEASLSSTEIMLKSGKCDSQQYSRTNAKCSRQVDNQDGSGVKTSMQTVVGNIGASCVGKDLKQLQPDNTMGFDPIKQHRHFCPWIASSGNSSPGWKQTLSALQRHKEFSCPVSDESSSSSSLIEVDDPVGSVKRLFMSPSAKRMKLTDC